MVPWARLCLGCSWGAGLGKLGPGHSWCPWVSFWPWTLRLALPDQPSPISPRLQPPPAALCATRYLSLPLYQPSASPCLLGPSPLSAFSLSSSLAGWGLVEGTGSPLWAPGRALAPYVT